MITYSLPPAISAHLALEQERINDWCEEITDLAFGPLPHDTSLTPAQDRRRRAIPSQQPTRGGITA